MLEVVVAIVHKYHDSTEWRRRFAVVHMHDFIPSETLISRYVLYTAKPQTREDIAPRKSRPSVTHCIKRLPGINLP